MGLQTVESETCKCLQTGKTETGMFSKISQCCLNDSDVQIEYIKDGGSSIKLTSVQSMTDDNVDDNCKLDLNQDKFKDFNPFKIAYVKLHKIFEDSIGLANKETCKGTSTRPKTRGRPQRNYKSMQNFYTSEDKYMEVRKSKSKKKKKPFTKIDGSYVNKVLFQTSNDRNMELYCPKEEKKLELTEILCNCNGVPIKCINCETLPNFTCMKCGKMLKTRLGIWYHIQNVCKVDN